MWRDGGWLEAVLYDHGNTLRRIWDVNKANYAAAKSLIRHSFTARILHLVMKKKGFKRWADFAKWVPQSLQEVQEISAWIVDEYATADAAKIAKSKSDDWAAHDAYFLRDALIFLEFEQGVAFADAGRLLRVMKYWCLAFRGAGQHNYGRECAEILLHWKYELTEGTVNGGLGGDAGAGGAFSLSLVSNSTRKDAFFVRYGHCVTNSTYLAWNNGIYPRFESGLLLQ